MAFLALDCEEAMYGGAAGGGKSSALLMAALQYVHVPGYSALILRKTFPDLSQPGAIMSRAQEWFAGTDARWKGDLKAFVFPSGAKISFGYLANAADHLKYQGGEHQLVCFDELTQFPSYHYRYLFSRLRRLKGVDIPIRMRSATNPGGPGGDWVKKRFITTRVKSRIFIPALFQENPHLDLDEYSKVLKKLDPVTRRQLERGDWFCSSAGLTYPGFAEKCAVSETSFPWHLVKKKRYDHYGGIDWGFNNPFAAWHGVLDDDDVLWVYWCRYKRRMTVAKHASTFPRSCDAEKSALYFADPSRPENISELVGADIVVRAGFNRIEPGIDIVTERMEAGRLKVLETLTPMFEEAGLYTYDPESMGSIGDEEEDEADAAEGERRNPEYDPTAETGLDEPVKQHDHLMDALRYGVVGISRLRGATWADELADSQQDDDGQDGGPQPKKKVDPQLITPDIDQEEAKKFRRLDNPDWW